MILSRFWYGLLACSLAFALVLLYLSASIYNRAESRSTGELLNSDRQVLSWSLRSDSRERASLLLKFALDDGVVSAVTDASASASAMPEKAQLRAKEALSKVSTELPRESAFDAVFAVDQYGRVVGQVGFDAVANRPDFDLGGYAVVADALRGYVRDDTLLMKRLYRVVARPLLHTFGSEPVGAIVGATLIDAGFAQKLAEQTQAAVAFYYGGQRREIGAPVGFSKGLFDQIEGELPLLASDEDYKSIGSTKVRWPSQSFGVIFTRLPGEAWELGAGFAVGRQLKPVTNFLGWWTLKDEKDKAAVNVLMIVAVGLLALGVGLVLSYLEHNRPIRAFAREASRLGRGELEQLQSSKFRGDFRKVASDINDGLDHAAAKGGHGRRPADLQQVLGEIPAQPQLSAFSFVEQPETEEVRAPRAAPPPPPPDPPARTRQPELEMAGAGASALAVPNTLRGPEAPAPGPKLPEPPPRPPLPRHAAQPDALPNQNSMVTQIGVGNTDPEQEWRVVFEEFVRIKEQCGERTNGLTYDRFRQTLLKNQANILQSHEANRVRFSVYVKDGKAALKASPLKD